LKGDSMASHRAANIANLGLSAATGAATGGLIGGPPGAVAGGLAGLAKATYENVTGHGARKAAKMAKKGIKPRKGKGGDSGDWWNGKGESVKQIPLLSPEQIAANNALRPKVLEQLQQGNTFDFGPQEAKSRENFAKYTRPGIAEMFKAHGGGTNTDAYENALGVAQREHEQGLDILRNQHGFQQQALSQDLAYKLFNQLQQPQHQNLYTPATPSFLEQFAPGAAQTALQVGLPLLAQGASNFFNRGTQPTTTPAAPTIGQASTPAGQAAQNIATATAGANVTGGARTGAQTIGNVARQGGFTTAGRALGGLGLGIGGLALTNFIVNQLRGGQQ
jgi:hypothetical protein